MNDNRITLFCLVDGEDTSNAFPVDIEATKTIGHLKELIKVKKAIAFSDIAADRLILSRVSIPIIDDDENSILLDHINQDEKKKLGPATRLSRVFPEELPEETVHIIVQRPPRHVPVGMPLSVDEWRQLVTQVESDFFSRASANYTGLVQFVKGGAVIPTTEGESTETQDPPSTADKVLDRIYRRAFPQLPLFGAAGCGKTRTVLEMLCKNWGFYFNASETDWGSSDVVMFVQYICREERYQSRDMASNNHVHVLALALALARIIILNHCLDIAEREGTAFTCKQWMLFQAGFRTMGAEDLFAELFKEIADRVHSHSISTETMGFLVRRQFSSLRQRLAATTLNAPTQRVRCKILLVIDDAQNLRKMEFGAFPSRPVRSDDFMRPILYPLVQGLCKIAHGTNSFCVVPCGTTSICDMDVLEDSGSVPKGYFAELGPFTDFQDWE
ncbi:hypothetical protein DFQ27_009421 [Actinomortierella ambigua]|uniref:Crinkler effector protein N-terminal domain-containing protein n=1 Tax=Actinomortierella ambigua TaxID=1343610 RepID=A0A9P6PN19_9FUNG|nr:hypothetical protein DFQ27_009421 [Actinomortierella ambigua]